MSTAQDNFVLCIRNEEYPASLEVRKVYRVVRDSESEKQGLLRIIDESGEDYLYPKTYFASVSLSPEAEHALVNVA